MQAADPELHPFVVIGFLIAFALAFGIGANDVANSFGTSVGSKVLTLRQACILASIFEILGAILIGGKVSATIREGIMDPLLFRGNEKEYCLGLVASLAGCCIWMLLATFFKLPVSGTHSIVGSTMGFALVSRGSGSIRWKHFAKIVASWFISPLLSGLISVIVYVFIRRCILYDPEMAFVRTLRWLPFFYGVTILINVLSVLLCGPSLLFFDRIPFWSKMLILILVCSITVLVVQFCLRPRILRDIKKKLKRNDLKLLGIKTGDADEERFFVSNTDIELNRMRTTNTDVADDPGTKYYDLSDSEYRTFTVEPAPIQKSKDADVQVDYIALLNDGTAFPATHSSLFTYGVKWNHTSSQYATAHLSSAQTYDDHYTEGLRPSNLISDQHAYATYRHPEERYKVMPRFAHASNMLHLPPSPNRPGTIELYTTPDQQLTDSKPVAGTMIFNNQQISASNRDIVPKSQLSHSSSSGSEDSEPDEIEKRVQYISSVKSQHKRDDEITDSPEVGKLFSFLQILTAVFGSFAHGGNDVSNAIGPLISLWLVFAEGTVTSTKSPLWVLFYGGVGIIVGLWIWGRRVINTIGEGLTKITPSVGFVIEVSTAFTVLFASNLSIPVSTTHCKVGSVVFTGRVRSKQSVDWSLFGNIIIAWLVTVPVTGILSAALTALFRNLVI